MALDIDREAPAQTITSLRTYENLDLVKSQFAY